MKLDRDGYTAGLMGVDPHIVKQAQAIFDHAGSRALRAYRLIASLLEFMRHGAPSAMEGLVADAARAAHELVARSDFGTDEQRTAALTTLPDAAEGAAKNTITDAAMIAEAASIVFMHSMVDTAAHDYCQICAMLDPSDWYGEVLGEKITLAQARGDVDALLRTAVEREIKRLNNESLPRKIEVLQAVCKPGGVPILKGYVYDAGLMKQIDEFRHRLVHQRIEQSPVDVLATIEFMERTQVYLSALITHRHGLKLGPGAMTAAF
jgi:hypothetical protein